MSSALGILGLYFTLIGFISGLFFTRIDSWYGSVRGFHGKVGSLTDREDFVKAKPESSSLAASMPLGSFIMVGLFVTALVVLAFAFPISAPEASPLVFLYGPLVLTLAAYWFGGALLLRQGKQYLVRANQLIKDAENG